MGKSLGALFYGPLCISQFCFCRNVLLSITA